MLQLLSFLIIFFSISNSYADDCHISLTYKVDGYKGEIQKFEVKLCPTKQVAIINVNYPIDKQRMIRKKHYHIVTKYLKRALIKDDLKKYIMTNQLTCAQPRMIEVQYNIENNTDQSQPNKLCLPKNSMHFYEIKKLLQTLTYSDSFD